MKSYLWGAAVIISGLGAIFLHLYCYAGYSRGDMSYELSNRLSIGLYVFFLVINCLAAWLARENLEGTLFRVFLGVVPGINTYTGGLCIPLILLALVRYLSIVSYQHYAARLVDIELNRLD